MTRYRVLEFTPQLDVELPRVRLSETKCELPSYGVVYDLKITLEVHPDDLMDMETTLTVEELTVLRDYINHLLELRDRDPERQGK